MLESVGQMTIPLSMLMIGGLLANLNGKELWIIIQDRHIWFACLAKLIGIPLLLLPAFFLPIPDYSQSVRPNDFSLCPQIWCGCLFRLCWRVHLHSLRHSVHSFDLRALVMDI